MKNYSEVIVFVIVGVAVLFSIKHFFFGKKSKKCCDSGCSTLPPKK